MRFELPSKIVTREDALRLWLHLIELDAKFSWDKDPAAFLSYQTGKRLLTARDARRVRVLLDQARQCPDERVVRDAVRLSRLARTLGPDLVSQFALDDVPASFERLRRVRRRLNRFVVDWRD